MILSSPLWADMADRIQMCQDDVLNLTDLICALKDLKVDRVVLLPSPVTFSSQKNAAKIEFEEGIRFPEGCDFAIPADNIWIYPGPNRSWDIPRVSSRRKC